MFRLTDATEPPNERELIDRTLAGDGDAFALLVDRFQRKIFRVAFAIVRNDGDADTIAQDTFIQAYTHLARFEHRSGFETWLTRIAINKSRDHLRRRRFVSIFTQNEDGTEELLIEPVDERPDAERQFHSHQIRNAITRAERTLSAQQKVIFRLRHYQDLSAEEISEHLGLQSATVRVHLFRAIQKIRKELASWRQS